jgi:type II secretory pathway pseudopilin PulG
VTARPRTRDRQAGITLVELTVVVALLGVVLALAFQGLHAYQRAAGASEARIRSLEEARTMMAVLTKDLRTATGFVSSLSAATAGRDVTFTANLNTAANAPANQVRLYVDAQDRLREDIRPPDTPLTSPPTYTGAWTSRIVGQSVVPGTPLFTYLDADGDATTDPAAVVSVDVTVSVDVPSATPAPATTLTSRVFLPNLAATAAAA